MHFFCSNRWIAAFFLLALSFSVSGQEKESKILIGEKGLYPLYNFSTKEYQALPQNWAITQDRRGVMYFGNNLGILEYDGVSWRLTKVPNETNIRCFAVDGNGKIYLGASSEFGYLEPDASGSMKYISLVPKIDKADNEFTDIWCAEAVEGNVYFMSDSKLFRWDGKKMKVWNANKTFHRIFYVNGRLYIREREVGLLEVKGDEIVPLKGGEAFADESIYAMIPFPGSGGKKDVLLCTRKKGLFVMKSVPGGDTDIILERFQTQVDPFLMENLTYHMIRSGEGYSVATITKGAVNVNALGELVSFLNKDIGMLDETIYSQFIDASGNLWLSTSNGISRINIKSPVTYFSDKNGPGGMVQAVARHNHSLYVTTVQGVLLLKPGSITNGNVLKSASFEKIPAINEECWDILSFRQGSYSTLLVASNINTYAIDDNGKVTSLFPYGPWEIHRSVFDSSRVFLGLNNGFASIYWDGTKWIDEGTILEIKESIISLKEDKDRNLWIGHIAGAIKVTFKEHNGPRRNTNTQSYTYRKYNRTAGLPEGSVVLENIDGKMSFFTVGGIYRNDGDTFFPDHSFGKMFSDSTHQMHRARLDKQSGRLWVETYYPKNNKFEFGFLKKEKDGTWSWNNTPFLPYSDEIIQVIYHDGNGITWFGGAAGLFRYDANRDNNETVPFNSIIRRVTIGKDSTLFNGTFYDSLKINSLRQNPTLVPTLPFASNSIIFEFSLLDFSNEKEDKFQYFLEGFDKEWSNWRKETKAVYTNLPEGNYTFRVKGKNIFNHESTESSYEFTILPPWYRTWWAYVLYVLASVGFIYAVVTYVTRGLKAIIKERTAEIMLQKEEIEYKNRNITDSINYAKRIQEAILPPYETLRSHFPESFILYRPKDIVAGDFYWFSEKDRKFMVAACDCTGHGVPGAFMSLIGSSIINEVILEKSITNPANALDAMKKGIIKSLGQKGQEGEQKDGMDMSLVSLEVQLDGNKARHKLSYAGANNSLYIVRKGELIELNADKMPIGIYMGIDRPFTNKEMLLEAGDTIYLFTDGYADQFGGDQGKKFTKKRFKETLVRLGAEPLPAQRANLEKTLYGWAGEQQQVDDVLVIGIRI